MLRFAGLVVAPLIAPDVAAMAMLVDYAASDDDDDDPALLTSAPVTPPTPSPIAIAPPPPLLPSAAALFDDTSNHNPSTSSSSSSSLPRKRPQVNGTSHPSHAPKVPRAGSNSSSVRTTPPSASLVPPQLRGRSNVATEDLDKLFVHRHQRKPE